MLPAGRVTRWSVGALASPVTYLQALDRAGADAVLVPPFPRADGAAAAAGRLRPFAGLVLTGGGDVDPALYGEAAHAAVYGVDAEVDRFEIELVDAAIDADLPVLAICRGHQLLNVALGGTLHQHLDDGSVAHGDPHAGGGGGVDHEVSVVAGSRLADALGATRVTVRSHHHQGVARLGDGAVPTATADDGLNEGFELADGWVVAVQWHPEMTAADDPVQQRLFDAFVASARRRGE